MKFDAYAVLAKLRAEGGGRAIRATCAIQPAPNSTNSTNSTDRPADAAKSEGVPCSTSSTNSTGQAVQAQVRKEAYEALHPEVKAGATGRGGKKDADFASFSDDQAAKTGQSAKVIRWQGRSYSPEAIRQGVTEAFADYHATDDPHDPRAWA